MQNRLIHNLSGLWSKTPTTIAEALARKRRDPTDVGIINNYHYIVTCRIYGEVNKHC